MNNLYAAVVNDVSDQLTELSMRLEARGDAQKEMGVVMAAARRLSEMLLMYKQANELLSVNPKEVNAADFVEILAAEYRELFPALKFEVHAEQAQDTVFFDDALVRLAMANSMFNACRVARSKIKLSAYQRDNMLVLEIADDGPGYPEKLLSEGISAPSAVSKRGTGMGLYLAKKIAELHHSKDRQGAVELHNEGGAVFRMILP